MSKVVVSYIIPKLHYLLPITTIVGMLTFYTGYKLYYSRPARRRMYNRNEEYASQLWEAKCSQEGQNYPRT